MVRLRSPIIRGGKAARILRIFTVSDSIRPIRRLADGQPRRSRHALHPHREVACAPLEGSDMQVIALYTDVDRDAPFVRHADLAAAARAARDARGSYLDHDAADRRRCAQLGADAVWPGWGFVAESPSSSTKLTQAGHPLPRPVGRHDARGSATRSPPSSWPSGSACRSRPGARARSPTSAQAAHWAERIGIPLVLKASRRRRRARHPHRRGARRASGAFQSASSRGACARSATAGCSWRRWCAAAATSRCRSSPTSTASCGRSAAATARCSAAIRR